MVRRLPLGLGAGGIAPTQLGGLLVKTQMAAAWAAARLGKPRQSGHALANLPATFSLRGTSQRLLIGYTLAGAASRFIVGPPAPGQVVVRHHTPDPIVAFESVGSLN